MSRPNLAGEKRSTCQTGALNCKAIMRRLVCFIACFTLAATAAYPQAPTAKSPDAKAAAPVGNQEARAARAYETAVHAGPLALYAFLAEFPKGADLHRSEEHTSELQSLRHLV